MTRPVITTVDIDEQAKRADGAVDMLVRVVLKTGEERWLGIREGEQEVMGVFEEVPAQPKKPKAGYERPEFFKPKPVRRFVLVARRRTRAASLADLIAQKPSLLRERKFDAQQDFWALNADERERHQRELRAKREWRVHEIATYDDGSWVARLSCSKVEKLFSQKTQLVMRYRRDWDNGPRVCGPGWQDKQFVDCEPARLLRLLSFNTTALPELLAGVTQGETEERTSKALFEAEMGLMRTKDLTKLDQFDVVNAVRQQGADREAEIEIVEEFKSGRQNAFLLRTSRGWAVMEVREETLGGIRKARLAGSFEDTAFDTPVRTARALLGKVRGGDTLTEEQVARKRLRDVVEQDLSLRFYGESFHGQWLVTGIADLDDGRLAVKATLIWPLPSDLPVEAPRSTWHILVTGTRTVGAAEFPLVYALGRKSMRELGFSEVDYERRFRAAVSAAETGDQTARKILETDFLRDGVRYGHLSRRAAELAWDELVGSATVRAIDGDADLVPHSLTALQLSLRDADLRDQWRQLHADGMLSDEDLAEREANLAEQTAFPPQLLALIEELRAANDESAGVETCCPPDRDAEGPDLSVEHTSEDLQRNDETPPDETSSGQEPQAGLVFIDEESERPGDDETEGDVTTFTVGADTSDDPTPQVASDETGGDKTKRKGGRPRIHADDNARKAAWKAKKRLEEAAANPGKEKRRGGRPRKYEDQAARQRAYVARKKKANEGEDITR